jgi:hypothetical protein
LYHLASDLDRSILPGNIGIVPLERVHSVRLFEALVLQSPVPFAQERFNVSVQLGFVHWALGVLHCGLNLRERADRSLERVASDRHVAVVHRFTGMPD